MLTSVVRDLPADGNPTGGVGLVTYLVVLTQANDVAQYVWGKALGRRAIIPKVSPNKTWEGFLGGLATTTLAAVLLAPVLTPFSLGHSLLAVRRSCDDSPVNSHHVERQQAWQKNQKVIALLEQT